MKYLIAPTHQIGQYWARQLDLKKNEYKIISDSKQIRGIQLAENNTILINGSDFDSPEASLRTLTERLRWYETRDFVREQIKRNKYAT